MEGERREGLLTHSTPRREPLTPTPEMGRGSLEQGMSLHPTSTGNWGLGPLPGAPPALAHCLTAPSKVSF